VDDSGEPSPAATPLWRRRMRRMLGILAAALVLVGVNLTSNVGSAISAKPPASHAQNVGKLMCSEGSPLSAETADSIGYGGQYTGHDEPSLLFYSDQPGAGNNLQYRLVVPRDPPVLPKQNGEAGTFNFQDRIAFWLGMDLCDNQSAPEFTHAPCTPNSDSNI